MKNKFNKENLKVGDKVLLKNRRGEIWNSDGDMDKFMGKIVTIKDKTSCGTFKIEEDSSWVFEYDDIERLANDITLSDLQFADILTLRNRERYVVADNHMRGEDRNHRHEDDAITTWYNDDLTQNEDDKEEDIIKVERAGQIIYERQEAVEMTITEISEKLGYEIKVVKEK